MAQRRTPTEIVKAIRERTLEGHTPIEIYHELERRFEATYPSRRTVEYIAKEVAPRDVSGDWRLAEAPGEEARLVLPVLAEVVRRTNARTVRLTVSEAQWIARLRTSVPDIPLWEAYAYARVYMGLVAEGKPTAGLDVRLAFGPWRGDKETAELLDYEAAVAATPEARASNETLARITRALPGVVRAGPPRDPAACASIPGSSTG
jgi:hypothetical protein